MKIAISSTGLVAASRRSAANPAVSIHRSAVCRHAATSQLAFTMIEIALCLAIVGFALVAIIGALPMGLNVQKENREETIINQDATVWIDALRAGGTNQFGVYDNLVKFVDRIGIDTYRYDSPTDNTPDIIRSESTKGPFQGGWQIIGILGTPQIQPDPSSTTGGFYSNYVYAYVRAMNGVAADLPPQDNADVQDNAFGYKLIVQSPPAGGFDPVFAGILTNQTDFALRDNLRDVRLLFRWPVKQSVSAVNTNPAVGTGRLVYRTQISGRVQLVANQNVPGLTPVDLYFLQSRDYQK